MFLDAPSRTVFVEDALGDPGKNIDHRIDSVILSRLREIHNSPAVREELSVEELVHDVQLGYDVDQTQTFAGPVADGVQIVPLEQKIVIAQLCVVCALGVSRKSHCYLRRCVCNAGSLVKYV